MFKRIRDFIYDINDIFVALLIVLVAAGIILWRSASIMDYPKYLSAKGSSLPSRDVSFTEEDLTPVTVDPVIVPSTENTEQNAEGNTSNTVSGDNTQTTNTVSGDTGNTVTTPSDVVTASITIEKGFKGGWYAVADRLIAAKLITKEDKTAFVNKVNELGLATKLQIRTVELSSDMTHEQMIKKLCNVK